MDLVLPPPEAEVDAAAKDVGLVARFAVEGNHRAFGQRTFGRPQFFYNADAIVGDVPNVSHSTSMRTTATPRMIAAISMGMSSFQWECARITGKYSICTGKRERR